MKRPSPMLLLSAAVIVASVAAASVAQEAQPPTSNTVVSERDVHIVWEDGSAPPDLNNVLRRLTSDEVAGAIAKRVLNVEPQEARQIVRRSPQLAVKDHSCTFSFAVSVSPERPGARRATREFADELVNELSNLLVEDRLRVAAERAKRVREELENVSSDLDDTRRRIREKREQVLQVSNRVDFQSLSAGIAKLEDDRQRLELDLAGMEARLVAVQEQIASVSDEANRQAGADPVLAEFEKAVAARQKLMDITRKQYEAGQAPLAAVSEAEAALIDARVNWLERRGAASATGADALAPLTRDLQTVSIEIRDRKARLQHVERQLKPMRTAAREFLELEWMQEEAAALRRRWEEATARLLQVQREADAAPVDRVIVTHATDGKAPADAPAKQ